jgi:hypothetical protein
LFFFFLFCISAALASFLCLCPRRSRRLNLLAHPLVLSVSLSLSLSVCVCVCVCVDFITSPHFNWLPPNSHLSAFDLAIFLRVPAFPSTASPFLHLSEFPSPP